jgi:hypothetical protein
VAVIGVTESFVNLAFLCPNYFLGFKFFGRQVEIRQYSFVQAAVRTKTVIFKCCSIPEAKMAHAAVILDCPYSPEYLGERSFQSIE